MKISLQQLLAAAIFSAVFAFGVAAKDSPAKEITVFAAASLTDALKEVSDAYTKSHGIAVRASYGASSALARQIEAGAHADVFFSADTDWVDYLQTRKLLDASTRRNVLGNRLVLIAPTSSNVAIKIAPNFPLAQTLGKGRIATGDPDAVPVGRYARSALTTLGVWNDVSERVVRADNVRVALAYVARGEAALGIVYETDAMIEKNVRVVDVFPSETHAPIVYPIGLTPGASAAARDYLAFVTSKDAAVIFKKYGFSAAK